MIPERLATALADRYRIERELGQGGMATVYLAHDLKHDRQVAIKVLRPELAAAIGAERFLSEIKTTANLQHPHILPLFDSGIADSFLFYVMPFVEGESLRDRLNREKQLPIGDAVRIATEVAGALDYAHRHNVIHRDIKPENILLHDGRALVADFGIALAASKAGGARMTETGMSLGTPTYMSPEQAMGEREITARSDVYALGCVLYEMLVGEPPFTGPTAQAIVAKVMTAEPTALHQLRKTVPAVVEEATLRALEKLPADRYATAAEFATALTQSPTGVFPRATSSRHLDWRVALAGVLLGVVLGVTYMVLRGSAPGTGAAERRQQLTFNGRSTQPAISPDGAWVAYNDVSCRHGSSDLCSATLLVQEVGSTQAVPIIRDALSLSAARWSHDGSQLVIAGQLDAVRSGLFVIPRTGGVARLTGPAGAFDTHPSGDTVVVVRSNPGNTATALFINLSSGAVADSVAFPVTDPLDIAWSPDGRHIAANAARYQLAVISREGKEEGRLTFTARQSIRWNVAGDAILTFTVGAVKEDEFIRVPVDRDGGLTSPPSVVVARVPTLYAGLFDVARRTGRIVLATGDAITDLYTFSLTPGNAGEQQRTRGTTWYGTPSFSPDGSTLYYGRGDALGDNVYALTLKDGAEEALTAQELPFGSAVRVSVDGHRLSFGHALPNGRRMDVLELPSRRILSQMAGGSASVVWPLGERGYLDGSGDRRTLQVLDSLGGSWRSVVAPDSMSIDNFAPSPDGRRAAVMVTTAHATLLGTVSLAEWEFHVIARWPFKAEGRGDTPTEGPGAVSGTSISWESNRSIYFTAWPRADEVPSLWRIDESGGTPARVVNVPSVCEPRSISLNLATRLGSCVSGDYRRDIWIMEGVEGR